MRMPAARRIAAMCMVAVGICWNLAAPRSAGATVPLAEVAGGGMHTCALTSAGAAWCWGRAYEGQLGDDARTDRATPTTVAMPDGKTFSMIATGYTHTCALATDGTGWCWGDDEMDQGGDGVLGTLDSSQTPRAVAMPAAKTFTKISAGWTHTCALAADGKAWCWGSDTYGERGDGGSIGVRAGGPIAVAMPDGKTFTQIAAGWYHSCGLATDGKAWCWGWNQYGQLGDGTTMNRSAPVAVTMPAGKTFTRLSTSAVHTCALATDGTAWCWGANDTGQLGDGAATDRTTPVAVTMPARTTFSAIVAGGSHTCAIASTGKGWCWGANASGQLGDGTKTQRSVPTAVRMPTAKMAFASVALGNEHTCARATDGTTWCWGENGNSQIGDGTTTDRSLPTRIEPAFVLTLSKNVAGGGTITSSPAGISCGTGCSSATYRFPAQTTITLTAKLTRPYTTVSWSGCTPVAGKPLQCRVTTSTDVTVTATFS